MLKGKFAIYLLLILGLLLLPLGGCGGKQPAGEKPTGVQAKTIRVSVAMQKDYYCYKDIQKIADRINKGSKGALKVEIYPESSLYKDQDVIEAVASGAVEMTSVPSFWVGRIAPAVRLFELPGVFKSPEVAYKAMDRDVGAKMKQQVESKGIKLLGFSGIWMEWMGFATKKPVYVPGDLKGMKLRATSPSDARVIQAAGAVPQSLSGGELYMALQRGTIEGAVASTPQIVERKLYEVTNYLNDIKIGSVTYPVLINKKFFESLSPDLQKLVVDTVQEVCKESRSEAVDQIRGWAEDAKKKGVTLIKPSSQQYAEWQKIYDKTYEEAYKEVPELKELVAEVQKIEK